jgi:hypothetical protein
MTTWTTRVMYDQHAITHRAGVVLSAVITWLKALVGDMP